jgi:phospholipase A1
LVGIASLALEHESNGRDSIFSRSWNNIHATYNTRIGNKSRIGIKAWIPFLYQKDNPDLLDYIGLGELTYTHYFIKDKLELEIMGRKGVQWDQKGALRTRLFYSPFKKKDQYLMLEWFTGYSESLINYTEYKSMIRVGFVIRTKEFSLLH